MWKARRRILEENKEGGEGSSNKELNEKAELDSMAAQLNDMAAENARLTAKIGEANKHAKAAERKTVEEQRAKAEAANDYKQLYESSQAEKADSDKRYDDLQHTIDTQDCRRVALSIGAICSDGPNIDISADYIQPYLKKVDGNVKILDEQGNLTVSTPEEFAVRFRSNPRFASIVKGNQSSGGSASGGANSGSATNEVISRADFDALTPVKRSDFLKRGGKIE